MARGLLNLGYNLGYKNVSKLSAGWKRLRILNPQIKGCQMSLKKFVAAVAILPAAALLSNAPLAHADDAPPLDIHGFGILNFQKDYITPRGLFVTGKGETVQVIDGLVFGLTHDDSAPIDDVAFTVGTFNDIYTAQHAKDAGSWNEFDWFAGPSFNIEKNWQLDIQIGQFLSPPGNFKRRDQPRIRPGL